MIRANYHTHTFRCRHAAGDDREFVEAAIEAGIHILGFSDHAPYVGFDGDYYSGYRMMPDELEDYVFSINTLKAEYRNDIEIHLGLEAEYYPSLFDKFLEFIKPYKIEYFILGQHFTDSDQYNEYAPFIFDSEGAKKYTDTCIEAMKTGLFSYVAHPDILGFDRVRPEYAPLAEKYCRAAKELALPLELNFLGLSQHRNYPCDEFFSVASKVGNTVIYGQDAHRPDAFFDLDTEMRADKMMSYYGLSRTETIDMTRLSKFFGY